MRQGALILLGAVLAGCGSDVDDLRQFTKDAENRPDMKRRIEPLPQAAPYEPFAYNAFELPDPFKPRKIEPIRSAGTGVQPDLARRKEPLEAYPLESLKMVGTLQQNKVTYALVRTPDNSTVPIKVGNYVGQNFGLVTGITDSGIKVKEIVQDGTGEWTERTNVLQLQDEQEQKK